MKRYRYLNFKLREDVFLKKNAIGKNIEDLTPNDIKDWVRKFWWEKTSEMHLEENGIMVEPKMLQHFWHCLYGSRKINKKERNEKR